MRLARAGADTAGRCRLSMARRLGRGRRKADSIRYALAYVPLLVLAIWVAGRAHHKLRWALSLAVAGIAIYALGHQGQWPRRRLRRAARRIYLALLAPFACTLRPGHAADHALRAPGARHAAATTGGLHPAPDDCVVRVFRRANHLLRAALRWLASLTRRFSSMFEFSSTGAHVHWRIHVSHRPPSRFPACVLPRRRARIHQGRRPPRGG